MKERSLILILFAVVLVIGSGTVFFRMVEGWSWVDAYFFTVVTLSTVGYGDQVPQTDLGKIATTIYIISGIGLFAWAIQSFGAHILNRNTRHAKRHLRDISDDNA